MQKNTPLTYIKEIHNLANQQQDQRKTEQKRLGASQQDKRQDVRNKKKYEK